MRTAIIEQATGTVVNIIELSENSRWSPPEGHVAIGNSDYAVGGTLIEGVYTPPQEEEA